MTTLPRVEVSLLVFLGRIFEILHSASLRGLIKHRYNAGTQTRESVSDVSGRLVGRRWNHPFKSFPNRSSFGVRTLSGCGPLLLSTRTMSTAGGMVSSATSDVNKDTAGIPVRSIAEAHTGRTHVTDAHHTPSSRLPWAWRLS